MCLITPKRLRENEEFMWRLAERQIDEFIDRDDGDFIRGYGRRFAHACRARYSFCIAGGAVISAVHARTGRDRTGVDVTTDA
jgi:hypothetical protein